MKYYFLIWFLLSLLLMGCAGSNRMIASDDQAVWGDHLPEYLERPGKQVADSASTACHNPLVAPEDGSAFTLKMSAGNRGYYQHEPPMYAMKESDYLLVQCNTGKVIGIIRRG